MSLSYMQGDATFPQGSGPKIIAHVCNNEARWGKGFVLALNKRWETPKARYLASGPQALGTVQFVRISKELCVANMIGQAGIKAKDGMRPVRYDAIEQALESVASHARQLRASIHMPRIGAGLAGGEWARIESILMRTCADVAVTVYDFTDTAAESFVTEADIAERMKG
jgi:O-acetyl-ADP-ribose deacetylase (regulator of RNase III)